MNTAPVQTARKERPMPVFDPATATLDREVWSAGDGAWRLTYACPSRSGAAPHELTCDPDGGRACCTCKGYQFHPTCCHTRQAREIVRVNAYNTFAGMDLGSLIDLDRAMVRQYGQGGLQGNIRYSVLGDALAACQRRQDIPATVARGKAAIDDLFGEAGD